MLPIDSWHSFLGVLSMGFSYDYYNTLIVLTLLCQDTDGGKRKRNRFIRF